MRRDEVIAGLKQNESAIRAFGVQSLYFFGSHARDEASEDSDIDVFVDKAPAKPFGFLEFTGLIIFIEDLFSRDVDVATRTGLHPRLRADIEAEAIRVF